MYRIFDSKEKKWRKDVVEMPNGDLCKYKGGHLWKRKMNLIPETRFIITRDIDIFDKSNKLVYEGDIIKISDKYGIVGYVQDFASYVAINPISNEYYPLDKNILNDSMIVGNVFDNEDFFEKLVEDEKSMTKIIEAETN